ncbi:MAG: Smr/MutS family protein [Spirochaetaceae bacterium]|nr:Smr/MutS family protein [Spirochaetaceae bacterium]
MDEKTLLQLDFFRIRAAIAGCCCSLEGQQLVESRLPLTNPAEITRLKEESSQWVTYLNSARTLPLAGWEPVAPVAEVLSVANSVLSQQELHTLATFCAITTKTATALKSAASQLPLPRLAEYAQSMPDLSQPAALIGHVLDKGGQLRDLPELREIRANIARIRREIDSAIRRYTSDTSLKDVLQSDVPVLRSDRQVLAVRSGSRGRIRGIIHEVSQTGHTVYIEPEEVVRKNNELVQEEFALSAEIRRIFRDLTASLAPFCHDIVLAHSIMVELDAAYGAARWAVSHQAILALDLPPEGQPRLLQARHPLLGEQAVPIDLVFPTDCRVLIITGPNTGGKTVTLKTLALFTLLNQSGFPLPAAEGTALPLCSGVFADIGDEQSLDQSLSTFSGHMRNIGQMLEHSDGKSLVLLDELGSGTDPQEGGAIAMAVLDRLIQQGDLVVVTTHHGVLKNYGYTHPTCTNASAEFDETTLAPTYRIRTGIPGESRALDIARRNGLPAAIVEQATAYLEGEQADISAMIASLTQKHQEADLLGQQLRQEQQSIREKRRRVDLKELQLRQREQELSRQDQREGRLFLAESRRMLENLVRELREGELTKAKTQSVKQFISQLEDAIKEQDEKLEQEAELLELQTAELEATYSNAPYTVSPSAKSSKKRRMKNKDALAQARSQQDTESRSGKEMATSVPAPLVFQEGATVATLKGNRTGTLLRSSGKNSWLVQVGSLKLTMKEKDLRLLQPLERSPAGMVEYSLVESRDSGSGETKNLFPEVQDRSFIQDSTRERPVLELRLLGMRSEEAIKALERQLDLATMQGLHNFSIIHGKGNGVLQQAVHDYLSHYPGVQDFHFARPEEGGTGKTYVVLE